MSFDRQELRFEGDAIPFEAGDSIAAALIRAGRRGLRETASGGLRSIFCGMGVCQDCLVTVNGRAGQRACMTPAEAGAEICRQPAFPVPETGILPAAEPPHVIAPDVLVIGGGAAGLSAATAAARAGAEVVLLDERKVGGGQFFKQSAGGRAALDPQQQAGTELIEAARAAGVTLMSSVEIWGAFDGPLFLAEWQGRALVARPKTAVIATGAYERPAIVPGWTKSGVMTTGAAQTLWRSYRTLAGKRVALAGTGPLNLQVAVELARGGAEVTFVAEKAGAPLSRLRDAAAMALADPRLAAKGLGMLASLRRRGIPVLHGARLAAVEASPGGLVPVLADARGTTRGAEVDAVLMNEGFEPQNEILRLLGAAMDYDPLFGHLRCRRDESMGTSLPGIFAAGDCCGLGGAPAALVEGRIAGRAAAAASGFGTAGPDAQDSALLARHRSFQQKLWRLYAPAPALVTAVPDETIVCRCEEVTLASLRRGIEETQGTHAGTVKRATRLGMGRCQGRYCGPAAVRLLAAEAPTAVGGPELGDLSFFAPRVPLKPVRIATILATRDALMTP